VVVIALEWYHFVPFTGIDLDRGQNLKKKEEGRNDMIGIGSKSKYFSYFCNQIVFHRIV